VGRIGTVRLLVCSILFTIAVPEEAVAAKEGIGKTAHNLSASGARAVRAPGVSQVCIFCHTPHNAVPGQAMWNRDLIPITYKLYESSTLEAELKQPTGASRLCLSCHDGVMALNKVRDPGKMKMPKQMGPLIGRGSLGTDLSDDHPVSFVYDAALATKKRELVDPKALPLDFRLDKTQQLQCTSCHDSHESLHRKFLRRDDRAAGMCTLCHKPRNWTGSAHATSAATVRGTGKNPWADSPFSTVADNGCKNCHWPHAAPHPERLLRTSTLNSASLACIPSTPAIGHMIHERTLLRCHATSRASTVIIHTRPIPRRRAPLQPPARSWGFQG
jgi:predicted CXXCH cytochrome family protein